MKEHDPTLLRLRTDSLGRGYRRAGRQSLVPLRLQAPANPHAGGAPAARHVLLDHAVADCATCARDYRVPELVSVLVNGATHFCPFCRGDMIESVRQHLYRCTMLPANVRRRARIARDTAKRLVKHASQLSDNADVLMRQSEAVIQSLRSAMRREPRRRA